MAQLKAVEEAREALKQHQAELAEMQAELAEMQAKKKARDSARKTLKMEFEKLDNSVVEFQTAHKIVLDTEQEIEAADKKAAEKVEEAKALLAVWHSKSAEKYPDLDEVVNRAEASLSALMIGHDAGGGRSETGTGLAALESDQFACSLGPTPCPWHACQLQAQ